MLAALLTALAAALAPQADPAAAAPPPAGHVQAVACLAEARAARSASNAAAEQAALAAAVDADPAWDLPRLDLADLLLRASDARAALALLQAPGLRRDNPRLPLLRAMALEQAGEEAEAARAYGEALALRDDVELRLHRALLLVRTGPPAVAIAELEQVRAERPGERLVRAHLADLYEAEERLAEAEGELRFLVGSAPADPAPRRRLAAFLFRRGQVAEAVRLEGAARALAPPVPRQKRALRPDGR